MITEDYVSFEVAKLLKEKGFDEPCDKYYPDSISNPIFINNGKNSCSLWNDACSAPTLQRAMKWLREIHNICIVVYPFVDTKIDDYYTVDICTPTLTRAYGHLRGIWKTYVEACEAAIKYCLENLI